MEKYDFKNLKTKRTNIDELVKRSLDTSKEVREVDYDKISKRQRIHKSLLFSDDVESHQLNQRITDCKKYNQKRYKKFYGHQLTDQYKSLSSHKRNVNKYINNKNVCQSLWCPNCRHYVSQNYFQKVSKRLEERLLPFEYKNEDFRHISGVIGLCDLDEDKLLKMIKEDTNKWRRIRYRLNTLIKPKDVPFIEVVYEFELVNWTFLRNSEGSDFKKKQIQQLMNNQRFGKNSLCGTKSFLFVHFHSITNLSDKQINDVFRTEYFVGKKPLIKTNQTNGLFVQKFTSTQTLEENLKKLCSYPFKDPHRFKHSFRGSDYRNGEYYEFDELSKLMTIYQKLQKRNWRGLFRTIENLISVDIVRNKKLFPSNHPIFRWRQLPFGPYRKRHNPLVQIELDHTIIVDSDGNSYVEGWDPNNFFPNGLSQWLEVTNKTKVGEQWFLHPQYEWLEIYKNIYKEQPNTQKLRDIRLEEFFYPNLRKLRKGRKGNDFWEEFVLELRSGRLTKEDLFKKTTPNQINYNQNWKEEDIKRYFSSTQINDVDKIPLNIEFNIEDERFYKRMETVQRLSKIEQQMFFNKMKLKEKEDRKKFRKEKEKTEDDQLEMKKVLEYFEKLSKEL